MVAKSNINGTKIPPGQLISFVQKGIMYQELERSVADDGTDVGSSEPFSLLRSAELAAKSAPVDGPAVKKQRSEAPAPAVANAPGSLSSSSSRGAVGDATTSEDNVTTLSGHTSEVFICAWNPVSLLLASGSGDSTARIWRVPEGPSGKQQMLQMSDPAVLQVRARRRFSVCTHICLPFIYDVAESIRFSRATHRRSIRWEIRRKVRM